MDDAQTFSTSSIVTKLPFILVERCYDDFKLFDYRQRCWRKLRLDSILLELCSTARSCIVVRKKNITVFDCEKQFIKVTQYFDFLNIFFPLSCYSNEKPRETLEYIIRLFFRCNVTGNISSLLTDIPFRVAVTDHKVKEWRVNNDVQLARDLHRIRERRLRP